MAQYRLSGGTRADGLKAVILAISLFREAKRQLADVHAGRASIQEKQAPAAAEAARCSRRAAAGL